MTRHVAKLPRFFCLTMMPCAISFLLVTSTACSQKIDLPNQGRIVFLGDSITYSGQYVAMTEAIWRLNHPDSKLEWVNLGLPSETISGLSEKGHAGGRFPRPDLHERLNRIIKESEPDTVFACYGMNCGIYRPLSKARFKAYQGGVNKLRKVASENKIRLIHVTPPSFDPDPIRKRTTEDDIPGRMHVDYNHVLDEYSRWLIQNGKDKKWTVVDAHFPMNDYLSTKKKADPKFRLANDGVHINSTGHWLIAREILRGLKIDKDILAADSFESAIKIAQKAQSIKEDFDDEKYFQLIRQRQKTLALAWLSRTQHKRPGIPKGSSVEDAEKRAVEMEKNIQSLFEK